MSMMPENFLQKMQQGRAGVAGNWSAKDVVAHTAWYEQEKVGAGWLRPVETLQRREQSEHVQTNA